VLRLNRKGSLVGGHEETRLPQKNLLVFLFLFGELP
jgi:hypothetical protein